MRANFFLIAIFHLALTGNTQAVLEISNPSDIARKEEVIAIAWNDILSAYPFIDTTDFVIVHPRTHKEVPYQLEYRGAGQVQNLLLQITLGAKSQLVLRVQKGKPAAFATKAFARYVPERKDDFAWENDRIAFRMYGKALEATRENAFGTDVWVKRTSRLIVNDWYKTGDYHVDHGQGLDYYKVGYTLGAGDIAPYVQDSIWFPKNYRHWKLLDNGPLRTTFQLTYDEWPVASQKVRVTKTISLDAGSQLNRIEATYLFEQTPSLPVVVGIVKRKEPGTVWLEEKAGVMGYWEPVHGNDGTTGVGCLFTQPVEQMLVQREHLLAVLQAKAGETVVYFSGAAWDKAGMITTPEKWFRYLQHYQQKLQQPLRVVVRKGL